MDSPGGNTTIAGGICATCPHGKIEVIVWKHAVCWDTPPEGANAADPRFEGATVSVNTPQPYSMQAPSDGKVLFENLVPATYTVTATAPGYEDVTTSVHVVDGSKVNLTSTVTVERQQTSECDLVLRAKQARFNDDATWDAGRECLRRHAQPPPSQGAGSSLDKIFWKDEPMTLVALDTFWVLAGLTVVLAAVTSPWLGLGALSVAAIGAAFFAFSGAVIFGQGYGTAAIVAASAVFIALLVVNILGASFGLVKPDPYGMAALAGIWAAFGFGYLGGRRDVWRRNADLFLWVPKLYFWASAAIGAVAAGAIAAMLLLLSHQSADVLSVILAVVSGGGLGLWSGWVGFAFVNEGKQPDMPFGATDFQLPYLGERYCLQGVRGFWSHYQQEEGCYDWSMPFGVDVLSAKEGHIVAFQSAAAGMDDRACADHVSVRHRDGSIARYGYCVAKAGAIIREDDAPPDPVDVQYSRVMAAGSEQSSWCFSPAAVRPSADSNPVYARTGHRLGSPRWPVAPKDDGGGPRWWVFWIVGLAFAIVTAGGVFLGAATIWYHGPNDQIVTRLSGNAFDRLYNAGDSAYSIAWANAHPPRRNPDGSPVINPDGSCSGYGNPHDCSPVREMGCIDPSDPLSPKLGSSRFDRKYCECLHLGPGPTNASTVKQPSCVYSDFSFVLLGLWVLFWFSKNGPDRKPYANRMTKQVGYTLTFGLMLMFMGPGSMLFHISMNALAGLGDGVSMYLFMSYLLTYNIVRLADLGFGWFLVLWIGLFTVATVVNIGMMFDDGLADQTLLIMVVLGVVAIPLLLYIAIWRSDIQSDAFGNWSLVTSILFFIAAFSVWMPSQTLADPGPPGTPYMTNGLCHPGWAIFSPPSPVIQGHAIWHILSAFGVFLLYYYFKREGHPVDPEFPRLHFTVSEVPNRGPGIDQPAPVLQPGEHPHEIQFKPVKFTDGSVATDEARPWSMRKYMSGNQNLGPPERLIDEALFKPVGGEHNLASPTIGPGDFAAPGEAPGGVPPPSSPGGPGTPGAPPDDPASLPPESPPMGVPPTVPV
jgi:hypothetical protein